MPEGPPVRALMREGGERVIADGVRHARNLMGLLAPGIASHRPAGAIREPLSGDVGHGDRGRWRSWRPGLPGSGW
ncbi:MAG TPA: hypothetical protein VFQ44_28590 [Streptosporangiaceae bacterium]|nr:hypothetical protein [Streptosporangiaceae bacterium]